MRLARDEGGQAIALFALSLPLFLALLLLVIDGGRALVEHERLRNAAQFAAEAVVSMAGDPSGQVPTRSQAEATASAAVSRNLPGEPFAPPVVRLTPSAQGEPFRATVRVEKTFASTIQRITFTISATAAAQLGQSADSADKRAGAGPAAAALPPAPAAIPAAVPPAAPAAAGQTCGQTSVAGGVITVPGEIAKLTGQGRYTLVGHTGAVGARCGSDLYLGDGGATATYTLDGATAGDRYLWIRASDDGLHPRGERSVTIAINGQAALWTDEGKNVGWKWYPLGRFSVGEGQNQVRITKVASTHAAFVMDEFVLSSDPGFVPR